MRRGSRGAGPPRATSTDHTSMIPRGDRSGVVVEPMLTDQWYVRTKPLAEPAIAAVEHGRIKFVPENWCEDLFRLDAQHPGLVHLAPALVGSPHSGLVRRRRQRLRRARRSRSAAQARRSTPSVALRQDEDVLDTWFSSALWPFSTLGWPDETPELATFYPTNVLVTSFDIIFFWVARMIMMGLKFMGDVPFREVYIHALVRDHEGAEDVEEQGQHSRPARPHRRRRPRDAAQEAHRRPDAAAPAEPTSRRATRKEFPDGIEGVGTDALRLHVRVARDDGPRRALRSRARRGLSPLLQQAMERLGVRAQPARRRRRRPGRARHGRPLDSLAAGTTISRGARGLRDLSPRPRGSDAVRLRVARVLRLVSRAHESRAHRPRRRPGAAARRAAHARRRARRAAETAASADAVRHRGAVARARGAPRQR